MDLTRLLASPPAPDSAAQAQDLAAVLEQQKTRTPEQAALAIADVEVTLARFATVLGPNFRVGSAPATEALFKKLNREVSGIVLQAKRHWNRPRPYAVSEDIHPIVTISRDPAYPSGHSTVGYLVGLLLANMVPERRDSLLARGVEYGESRVVVGVHYPTDTAAGRVAATAIAAVLFQDAGFNADFERAKGELREVLKLR